MPAITPPAFDAAAAWGIGLLSVLVAFMWADIWSHGRRPLRLRLAFAAWVVMSISGLAARWGLLQRFDVVPPPMAIMIPAVLVVAVVLGVSALGRSVAVAVPLASLIGLQAFRLPLELLMHRAATLGIMPMELSYGGFNYDIVTGVGALVLFAAWRNGVDVPTWMIWAWNLWGTWCLLVIVAVAITTSPLVRLFGDDPRHVNTWVLFFPYAWVPVVLVTIAIATHIVVTRALLMREGGT